MNIIDIRNMGPITKAEVSINEWGSDYTDGDTTKVIQFELWIYANALDQYGTGATKIIGYQFDMDFDSVEIGAFDFGYGKFTSYANIGFNSSNSANAAITFNSETGSVAIASSTAIVDTNVSNDGPPSFLGGRAVNWHLLCKSSLSQYKQYLSHDSESDGEHRCRYYSSS